MRYLALVVTVAAAGCITEPGLIVEKTGDGDGRIVSDPPGIDCGAQCGALVTGPVTLTATPDATSVFTGWTGGGCSGTDPCTIDPTGDTHVEAKFAAMHVRLSVTPSLHGLVTSLQIDCGAICSADYEAGMTVRMVASPEERYRFGGWGDGNVDNPRLLTVNESMTLTPVFTGFGTLAVSVIGTGRVVSDPAGIDCQSGHYCVTEFPAGVLVTLTASEGSLAGWTGCEPGPANTCTVRIGNAAPVSATFN